MRVFRRREAERGSPVSTTYNVVQLPTYNQLCRSTAVSCYIEPRTHAYNFKTSTLSKSTGTGTSNEPSLQDLVHVWQEDYEQLYSSEKP